MLAMQTERPARRRGRRVLRFTSRVRETIDMFYDRMNGVETRAGIGLVPEGTRHADEQAYESPAWIHLKLIAKATGLGPGHTFVDYGCGAGRILCVAAQAGVDKVVGVEFERELAERCRRNLRALRGNRSEFEVAEGDAADFPSNDQVTHAFFFNPFGPSTLASVLDNLEAAVRPDAIIPLTAIYLHPVHRAVFDERPGWTEVRQLTWPAFIHPAIVYRHKLIAADG